LLGVVGLAVTGDGQEHQAGTRGADRGDTRDAAGRPADLRPAQRDERLARLPDAPRDIQREDHQAVRACPRAGEAGYQAAKGHRPLPARRFLVGVPARADHVRLIGGDQRVAAPLVAVGGHRGHGLAPDQPPLRRALQGRLLEQDVPVRVQGDRPGRQDGDVPQRHGGPGEAAERPPAPVIEHGHARDAIGDRRDDLSLDGDRRYLAPGRGHLLPA
jgi:hypothetical protein